MQKDDRPFIPVQIAVLTVSDTRTPETDTSGQALINRLKDAGHTLVAYEIVKDTVDAIQNRVQKWIADDGVQVVIATGGTGLTGRDVTPEAFEPLYDKAIPGFGELFRMLSYQKIGTSTIQSRTTAGLAGGTLLFALPGSTGAVKDGWDDILASQLDSRFGPCNFTEMMPRFGER